MLTRFFAGSAEDLVLRLIEDEHLSPEQLEELRQVGQVVRPIEAKERGCIVSLPTGTSWSATVLAFGLDLAAKATTLLLLGLIVQLVRARRRASLGSAVGNACLLGLLLLPFSASGSCPQ